jgi:hypothetical protein
VREFSILLVFVFLKMNYNISIKVIIFQLPTVSPTFMDTPIKSASKGEVPRADCIVKDIPI